MLTSTKHYCYDSVYEITDFSIATGWCHNHKIMNSSRVQMLGEHEAKKKGFV